MTGRGQGKDTFFTQTHCDRCGAKLTARIMSWFTDETICLDCSAREIKRALGPERSAELEGCGYVPRVGP